MQYEIVMIVSLINFALHYEYGENEKTNVCNASLIKPIYLSDILLFPNVDITIYAQLMNIPTRVIQTKK